MLQKIKNELDIYGKVYEKATEFLKKAKKEIEQTYRPSLFTDKYGEAKRVYDETLKNAHDECLKNCYELLEGIKTKANEVVFDPVDKDFINTVELLKTLENPTESEIKSLISNHENNYFACRALYDLLGRAEKGYTIATIDDIVSLCDELEETVRNALSHDTESYTFLLIKQGDYLKYYDEIFTKFISKDFLNALLSCDDRTYMVVK